MKTAKQIGIILGNYAGGDITLQEAIDQMQKECDVIQLDAMKEGMRRAANINCEALAQRASNEGWPHTYQDAVGLQKSILTAAEQLTEKDL